MSRKNAATEPDSASAASLRVEEISMIYSTAEDNGQLHAIDDVSMDLRPGTFCTLLGPSGCGKSTLLMLCAGLYRPSAGRIFIEDQRVTRPWGQLGMVFQRDALLEWRTVLDNILLPVEVRKMSRKAYAERAANLLEIVGLAGFGNYYPDSLSGGMRQRVAICRALITRPRLLLMDEPFAAVDALTRERLNSDLLRLTEESASTVVFVTHSIEEAALLSDKIFVMSPRPARIVKEIDNDLPKPRSLDTRSSDDFYGLVHEIRSVFHSMGLV